MFKVGALFRIGIGSLLVLGNAGAYALVYPPAPRGDQVDEYNGTKVADPYRWLEDVDSAQTRAWVAAEHDLAETYLQAIPERAKIRSRLTEMFNYERFAVPEQRGGRLFFTHNDGLQNQPTLFWSAGPDAAPQVLLDPNTLSSDGTVALQQAEPSPDGTLLAYSLAQAGSDWIEWRVREVASGRDLPEVIRWSKFSSASWARDGSGFYYGRYDAPQPGAALKEENHYQRICFHRLRTDPASDPLVFATTEHPDWLVQAEMTEDGAYLVVTASKGTSPNTAVFVKAMRQPQPTFQPLFDAFDAQWRFLGNEGPTFYFQTDHDAARGRLITVDVRAHHGIQPLISEVPETLADAHLVGDRLLLRYLQDARSELRAFDLRGRPLGEVALPGIGTAAGFAGEKKDHDTYYSFASFTTPPAIYRLDLATKKSALWRQSRLPFDPSPYETRQVFYTSRDGTRVPMFVVARKDLKLDGSHPTRLYGYGGFDIPQLPRFSVVNLAWLEMGGVYALANLRGGSEYGEEWHQAGTRTHKQHVFDDFIAAAEWLIANHYTAREKLAIEGGSNGGLLVAACLLQRPDLFGAAVAQVPVTDMLRFPKFTIGWSWVSDYGEVDKPDEFKALYSYSPVHNVKPQAYPPTLITTADHDDRVFPAHSFKFTAALQAAQTGPAPIVLRVETRAGHGGGKPMGKIIEEDADILSFLVRNLRMEGGAAATAAP